MYEAATGATFAQSFVRVGIPLLLMFLVLIIIYLLVLIPSFMLDSTFIGGTSSDTTSLKMSTQRAGGPPTRT